MRLAIRKNAQSVFKLFQGALNWRIWITASKNIYFVALHRDTEGVRHALRLAVERQTKCTQFPQIATEKLCCSVPVALRPNHNTKWRLTASTQRTSNTGLSPRTSFSSTFTSVRGWRSTFLLYSSLAFAAHVHHTNLHQSSADQNPRKIVLWIFFHNLLI